VVAQVIKTIVLLLCLNRIKTTITLIFHVAPTVQGMNITLNFKKASKTKMWRELPKNL